MSEANAVEVWRQATDVAGSVREFVLKGVVKINQSRHLRVEQWMAIANGFGCVASSKDVEVTDLGVKARGEIRRISDGALLGGAEGFVGNDEPVWANRPLYARMGMAQTRAISRACRSAFAFVVPIIDANLSTTPAEEMEHDEPAQLPPPPRKPAAKVTVQPFTPPTSSAVVSSNVEVSPPAAEPGADVEPTGEETDWAEYVRSGSSRADRFRLMRDVPPQLKSGLSKLLSEVK